MVGKLSSQDSTPHPGHLGWGPIELQEFDRLSEFENAVLESLSLIGKHSTFGCELEFVCMDTQTILADPIWDTSTRMQLLVLLFDSALNGRNKGQPW